MISMLFSPPVPRQTWKDASKSEIVRHHHGHESWVELFIDLVFVAEFINLSSYFVSCDINSDLFEEVFEIFMIFFVTRILLDEYSNFFFGDDLIHRAIYYIFTLGAFIMCLNTHPNADVPHYPAKYPSYYPTKYPTSSPVLSVLSVYTQSYVPDWLDPSDASLEASSSILRSLAGSTTCTYSAYKCIPYGRFMSGFLVGFLITRIALFLMILYVILTLKDAKRQFTYTLVIQGISASILLMLGFMIAVIPPETSQKLLGASVAIEIIGRLLEPFISKIVTGNSVDEVRIFPIDVYSFQNRLGVFVMMVLGESFIAMLTASNKNGNETRTYFFTICGMNLLFFFAMQFYDCIQRREHQDDDHALKRSKLAGAFWIWLHPFLSFMIFTIGVGLKFGLSRVLCNDSLDLRISRMIGYSCGTVRLIFAFQRALHKGVFGKKRHVTSKASRYLVYGFQLFLAFGHFMVTLRTQEDLDNDAKNNFDVVVLLHSLIAMIGVVEPIISNAKFRFEHESFSNHESHSSGIELHHASVSAEVLQRAIVSPMNQMEE